MKHMKAISALAMAGTVALGFWACGDHPDPTVKILQPANGSSVAGPNVLLRIETTNFGHNHTTAAQITEASAADGGHIHVYLDEPATTDAEADTVLEAGVDSVTMKGLAPGLHYIIVQGGSETHVPIAGMRDSVLFTVTLKETP